MNLKSELHRELHAGWQLREADPALSALDNAQAPTGWQPASVPGNVHQDLLAAGNIPDPYIGLNEQAVQWVADRDWCYRLDFDVELATLQSHTDLVFDGLDTFARVWLNGELVLESDNMFVPARVAVGHRLIDGRNRLAIMFDSALRRGREREALFGRRHLWNGDASRVYVRKAQYHYGWDWGPVLLTAGPWKPVTLHSHEVRIDEIDTPVWLAADLSQARIDVHTHLAGRLVPNAEMLCIDHLLFDPQGVQVAQVSGSVARAETSLSLSMSLQQPRLWWPAGHGAQALYRLLTRVKAGEQVLASAERKLGLHRLRLVQEPVAAEVGTSFYVEVNGKAMFAGGANWIPDDNLLNRITSQRYRERVLQARDANMLMLRVWAGGIYEDDAFYDACDELGVLVWQDFLFACGMYPAHADFQHSVQREAEAAVRRLRHRASLAIWCGNNEDYAIAESIDRHGSGKDMARFDARVIYEELLPRVCAALDPQRPYWPGSPYSPSATETLPSSDPTVGDRHSWEVWHSTMLPYQDYHKLQGRFVSEFGMQSHPSLPLLERVIPERERFAQSRTMTWHNKAGSAAGPDGHRRLAVYLADTLRCGPSLAEQVYATQFVQAEAMRYAYQDFRRRWQHEGARAVGGALVWQLNDCWPSTSWAIIDSAGTVKPAWHAIRRALASVSVALRLVDGRAVGWVMNDGNEPVPLRLGLTLQTLSGESWHDASVELTVRANGSTEFNFTLPRSVDPVVAQVLVYQGTQLRASDTAWPEPFRFHQLAPAGLTVHRGPAAATLLIRADKPAKGVWLAAEGLSFADNFLDLMAGQSVSVTVQGDLAVPISVTALDQGMQNF